MQAATAAPVQSTPSTSRTHDRAAFLAIGMACAGVLAIARWLTPDPRGFGTHTQLGLPPCMFRALTSLPCPGCGLTTAFAHMVRLQFSPAWAANPLGVVLSTLACLAVPLSLFAAVKPLALYETFMRLRVDRVALALAAFGLAQWLVRLAWLALH